MKCQKGQWPLGLEGGWVMGVRFVETHIRRVRKDCEEGHFNQGTAQAKARRYKDLSVQGTSI